MNIKRRSIIVGMVAILSLGVSLSLPGIEGLTSVRAGFFRNAYAEDGLRFGPSRGDEAGDGSVSGRSPQEQPPQPQDRAPRPQVPEVNPDFPTSGPLGNGNSRFSPSRKIEQPRSRKTLSAPLPSEVVGSPTPVDLIRSALPHAELEELVSLLNRPLVQGVEQQPFMAVADGMSDVRVVFSSLPGQDEPGLVLANLKLRRFVRKDQSGWVLTAVPEKGAFDATVFVNGPQQIWRIPVRVTPRREIDFDHNGVIDARDFALLRSAQDGNLLFDLSEDGRIGAEDHYIFVANYLLGNDTRGEEEPDSR